VDAPQQHPQIIGGYQVSRALGRGSMGEALLARRMGSSEEVVIKLLAAEIGADESYQERFEDEIMALG